MTTTSTEDNGTTAALTSSVTWASSAPAVATVSGAAGSAGTVTGVGVGAATISATDPATGVSGSSTVNVSAGNPGGGTGSGPGVESGDGSIKTLLTGLNYPWGLWVKGNLVYFTETAAFDTSFGGAKRLSTYDITTGAVTLLKDNPVNAETVVVSSNGTIYLGNYDNYSPGELGSLSVLDPTTLIETPLETLPIAIEDMFIDAADNIYVIGPSDSSTAHNVFFLPAGNYTSPVPLATGLGRTWSITESGSTLYLSLITGSAIETLSPSGTVSSWGPFARNGLTASADELYYADTIAGTLGRVDLATGTHSQTLATGLNNPGNLRYHPTTGALYYVEGGTTANKFTDGTLKVMYPTAP